MLNSVIFSSAREYAASSKDGAGNLMVTGGGDSTLNLLQIPEIFTEGGASSPGPAMPAAIKSHCQVQMGTSVYVIGGIRQSNVIFGDVFILDGVVWSEGTSMITPRYNHACIDYSGNIYAIGGHDGSSISKKVEIYNPQSNSWQIGPTLPTELQLAQVFEFQDVLYLLGGFGDSGSNTLVYTLIMGGEWHPLPNAEAILEPFRSLFPAPVVNSNVLFCNVK